MSLAKSHRTMPTTVWIYPTCCHKFGKSPTNVKDFQKIPTNSKRFHYNLENSNFPGGQSLLGDFSYFYNTWQTECLPKYSSSLQYLSLSICCSVVASGVGMRLLYRGGGKPSDFLRWKSASRNSSRASPGGKGRLRSMYHTQYDQACQPPSRKISMSIGKKSFI